MRRGLATNLEYRKDWEARYTKILVYGKLDIDLAVVAADAAYAHVAGYGGAPLPPWADVPTLRDQLIRERGDRIRQYRRSAIVRDYRSQGQFPPVEGPLAQELQQGILDACAYLQIEPVVPQPRQTVPPSAPGTNSLPSRSPAMARATEQRSAPAIKVAPVGRLSTSAHAVPAAVAAVMLMVAVGYQPSGYYDWLRWVVFVSAIATAVISDRGGRSPVVTLVFIVIALVWNPLIPVYLSRGVWLPLDLLAAGFMAWGATFRPKPPAPSGTARARR